MMENKEKQCVVFAVYHIIQKNRRKFGSKYVIIVLCSHGDRVYTNEMQNAL